MATPNPVAEAEHYERLNNRQKYPIKIDDTWEIDEDTFFEFLECLPPMRYHVPNTRDSFAISEFYSGSITSVYFQSKDGRYFHRWVDYDEPGVRFEG